MLRKSCHDRRRRGITVIQVLILLPVLMGFTTLTIDVGTIYNAKSDMQINVDAAALAAIGVIAYADPDDANLLSMAADAAMDYTSRNKILSNSVSLDEASDIIFGRAYFDDVANSYDFVAGDLPTNAVRIRLRYAEDSPNGRLPLFLAGAFGSNVTEITADATAIYIGMQYTKSDCFDTVPAGSVMMCLHGDSDDSDDSEAGDSDDSDDSDSGYSGSSSNLEVDSESNDSSADSDAGTTIILDQGATPIYLKKGATLGPCNCNPGDSDDSDDSEAGDSGDSDDSDPGDSDGSTNGDSDDSDDSEAGDSDDSDDSDAFGGSNDSDSDSGNNVNPPAKVTLCHIPPGNPTNGQTITISASAVAAHMAHGDVTGVCINKSKLRVFLIE